MAMSNQIKVFVEKFSIILDKNEITNKDLNVLSVLYKDCIEDIAFDLPQLKEALISNPIVSKFLGNNINKFISKLNDSNFSYDDFVNNSRDFTDNIINAVKNKDRKKALNLYTRDEEREMSKVIIKKEIMNLKTFEEHFSKRLRKPELKEAIGWIAGFIDTKDYDYEGIVHFDNKTQALNKRQTLKNLLNAINKQSITNTMPFETKLRDSNKKILRNLKHNNPKEYEKKEAELTAFKFHAGKSGELDVALWSEKDQKVISMCVTCDPTTRIEQNQFFRHYVKTLLVACEIEKHNKLIGKNNLSKQEVRNFVSSAKIKSKDRDLKIMDLSFPICLEKLREHLALDNKNSKKPTPDFINFNEMKSIISKAKGKIDFIFYGEINNYADVELNRDLAGYNTLSYINNLGSYGRTKTQDFSSLAFMRSFETEYNDLGDYNGNNLQRGLNKIAEFITDEYDHNAIKKLSEGQIYEDDRSNFFRAMKSFLVLTEERINHVPDNSNIDETLQNFFNKTLKLEQGKTKKLIELIKDDNFVKKVTRKINGIRVATSENPELKNSTLSVLKNVSYAVGQVESKSQNSEIQILKEQLKKMKENNSDNKESINNSIDDVNSTSIKDTLTDMGAKPERSRVSRLKSFLTFKRKKG
jgi:hypothetical protein